MPAPATSGLITVSNGSEAVSVSISYDPNFYQRVAAICTDVAIAVYNEGSGIDGHADRASRALTWFAQSSTQNAQIAMAILITADNTITESSTSQQIADKITSLWNLLSGN